MKKKISQGKSIQSNKRTGNNAFTVILLVVGAGVVWGVGYLFGHEILKFSKLTSLLIAPIFFLLLIVVFWLANNL
jgi:predicted membrane protein